MKIRILSAMLLTGLTWGQANAQVLEISSSALIYSDYYYTEMAGMGLGNAVVMGGGGKGANVGVLTGRNDDGFSNAISFGFDFSFFGSTYNSFYANNNGNISFGAGISDYTPNPLYPLGANLPIIAPFFADVDTRASGSGVMHLNQDVSNQTIVTWDSVGYYNQHTDLLNSFQLVVRGADYVVPDNEGTIGFFWKTMGWEMGDASGGLNGAIPPGLEGSLPTAAVGFGNGSSGLLESGLALDYSMLDGVAGVVQNHHIWFNIGAGGVPVIASGSPPPPPVPEPETYALLLAGLGLLGLTARRRKRNA